MNTYRSFRVNASQKQGQNRDQNRNQNRRQDRSQGDKFKSAYAYQTLGDVSNDKDGKQLTISSTVTAEYCKTLWAKHDYKTLMYMLDQFTSMRKITMGKAPSVKIDYDFFKDMGAARLRYDMWAQFYYRRSTYYPKNWSYIYYAMIPDSSYVPLYTKPELNILITLFMELKEASISFDKEITANNSTHSRETLVWRYSDEINKYCSLIIDNNLTKDAKFYAYYRLLLFSFKKSESLKTSKEEIEDICNEFLAKYPKLEKLVDMTEDQFNDWKYNFYERIISEINYDEYKPDKVPYNERCEKILSIFAKMVELVFAIYDDNDTYTKYTKYRGRTTISSYNNLKINLITRLSHDVPRPPKEKCRLALNRVVLKDVLKDANSIIPKLMKILEEDKDIKDHEQELINILYENIMLDCYPFTYAIIKSNKHIHDEFKKKLQANFAHDWRYISYRKAYANLMEPSDYPAGYTEGFETVLMIYRAKTKGHCDKKRAEYLLDRLDANINEVTRTCGSQAGYCRAILIDAVEDVEDDWAKIN